ncbi:putative membrane protein YczE [Motilibacter rhizosphaerae]|uniref:Putative membrane protein YczE n=1 Tax=Motilibacter rhizosphaerae TaxID=598652 RepID=A0A4Q7NTL5_9ACTN|nr:putative membrane protein YczE [Motilibacter rhizosphaerae]
MTSRLAQLLAGLAAYGLSDALLVRAGLGLDPWTALHQGLARQSGLSIGVVTNLVGVAVLLLWLPLRRRPGLGTVLNVALIGPFLDLALRELPHAHGLVARGALLVAGVLLNAVATAAYVGAGLGTGPRDGLSLGLAERGLPLWRVRTAVEVTVLVTGVLLGGTAGIGTVAYAVAIGPLVHRLLPLLARAPQTGGAKPPAPGGEGAGGAGAGSGGRTGDAGTAVLPARRASSRRRRSASTAAR